MPRDGTTHRGQDLLQELIIKKMCHRYAHKVDWWRQFLNWGSQVGLRWQKLTSKFCVPYPTNSVPYKWNSIGSLIKLMGRHLHESYCKEDISEVPLMWGCQLRFLLKGHFFFLNTHCSSNQSTGISEWNGLQVKICFSLVLHSTEESLTQCYAERPMLCWASGAMLRAQFYAKGPVLWERELYFSSSCSVAGTQRHKTSSGR